MSSGYVMGILFFYAVGGGGEYTISGNWEKFFPFPCKVVCDPFEGNKFSQGLSRTLNRDIFHRSGKM